MTVHDGHRIRVRGRFRAEGLEAFADHEILELLLFYGRIRGDTNPLAHRLTEHFGSIRGVLEASVEQLMEVSGIGEETATLLAVLLPVLRRYTACLRRTGKHMTNRHELRVECRSLLSGWKTERVYLMCLGTNYCLLGSCLVAEGNTDGVKLQPRAVAEAALRMNARAVVICHNHPGGGHWVSNEDVEITKRIQQVLRSLDVELLDHLIVMGEDIHSMEESGELNRVLPEESMGDYTLERMGESFLYYGLDWKED